MACALAFAALCGAGEARARSLMLAQPHAEPVIDALAPGYALWLERRLGAAGVAVRRAPADVAALADLHALATSQGAAYVLRSSLALRKGVAEVRL